jgi:hypothetical protein
MLPAKQAFTGVSWQSLMDVVAYPVGQDGRPRFPTFQGTVPRVHHGQNGVISDRCRLRKVVKKNQTSDNLLEGREI